MANQRALWAEPNVRRERQARAEAFMGRPMEFDDECAEMKSSKDIPPRVGMQVRLVYAPYPNGRFKISAVGKGVRCIFGELGIHVMCGNQWSEAFVEWIPPTDDERRLFMERRTHPDGFGHIGRFDSMKWVFDGHPADCPYCNRNWREIAESLALDGADYDNMPDFEELKR